MADDDAAKLRKKIREPRKKGRVGKAADGFTSVWRRWTRRVFKWVFFGAMIGVAISVVLVVMLLLVLALTTAL